MWTYNYIQVNDHLAHRSHKYISKHKSKFNGKWVYVYDTARNAIGLNARDTYRGLQKRQFVAGEEHLIDTVKAGIEKKKNKKNGTLHTAASRKAAKSAAYYRECAKLTDAAKRNYDKTLLGISEKIYKRGKKFLSSLFERESSKKIDKQNEKRRMKKKGRLKSPVIDL